MRWTGSTVRAHRLCLRMSILEFAHHLGVTEKSVRNWEHEATKARGASLRLLDDSFGRLTARQRQIFDDLLADRADGAARVETQKGVGAGPLSSAQGVPALRMGDLAAILSLARKVANHAPSDRIPLFRSHVFAAVSRDQVDGPSAALPSLLGTLGAINESVGATKGQVAQDLMLLGSQGAELAGFLYRDLGVTELARYWWDEAIRWARLTDDPMMEGYVLLRKSQAAWDHRNGEYMLRLSQAAREGPWHLPFHVAAEVAQQEARGQAMTGASLSTVEEQLRRAATLLEKAEGQAAEGSRVAGHYNIPLFHLQCALAYHEAGKPRTALALYGEYLRPSLFSPRDFAYFQALSAHTLAASGEPDQAAQAAAEALSAASHARSVRTIREVARLARNLTPWGNRPCVRDLLIQLEESNHQ